MHPDCRTLIGKRDCAILALLIGCGLRRAERVSLDVEHIQQREARWVLPDLLGKGGRTRTVTIPVASRPASISGPVRRVSARARYSGPSPRAVR